MALKPNLVFLLACFFLIAAKVASYVDTEEEKLALQRKAPIPAPVKAPMPTPVKAPPPAPVQNPSPPHCAPSPIGTPSPTTRTHLGYCVPKCQERCKANSRRIRPCVRVCTKCCEANNRCVPSGYENCPNWDTVIYHGEQRKCP